MAFRPPPTPPHSASPLATVARQLWRRGRESYRDLRPGTLPRLFAGLALGFGFAAALCYGLTLLARHLVRRHALAEWDRSALLWVPDHLPVSFTDAIIFESPGNLSSLVPLTLISAGVALWRRRLILAAAFPIAYVLARPLIWLGWRVWDRARPDLIADGVAALSAHSFPSGHVVQVMTVHGLLAWLWMRHARHPAERLLVAVLLLALAAVVGLARVRLGAHWPSDCVAGFLVGLAWLAAVALSITWAERHDRGARRGRESEPGTHHGRGP